MKLLLSLPFVALLSLGLLSCSPGEADVTNNNSNNSNNNSTCIDSDGDGICNHDEGADVDRDTDGDGTPDYLDADSDNDGIADAVEAGDSSSPYFPNDADGDGTPDYLDTDSDDNGIPDSQEGVQDPDGDGTPNFSDLDNDGDHISDSSELGDPGTTPPDTDGDGTPDYNDMDSDGDGIGDSYETSSDSDGDGTPNFHDLDSDNDGIPDSLEGGTNGDILAPPIDSDGDGHPDFRDADSDNDGLPDGQEDVNHNGVVDPGESDPASDDTDNDGVNDLIEVAAGTDPLDAGDSPRENGDFVFLEPYESAPDPPNDVLNFSTAFQAVDVYFLIDFSGSMSSEINSINSSIANVIDALVCSPGEDPSTTNCIPDLETGTGHYGGRHTDPALFHDKDINNINLDSDGPNSTQELLVDSAPGSGYEYHIQAMDLTVQNTCSSDPQRTGTACYRNNSLRLLVLTTDEAFSEDPVWPHSAQSYMDNLANEDIKVVGVIGESYEEAQLQQDMAALSGGTPPEDLIPPLSTTSINTAACNALSGNPFYNSRAIIAGANSDAANAITCAIQAVTAFIPQNVSALVLNDPANVDGEGNPVNAPEAFIDHIMVHMANDATCPSGYNTIDTNSDGFDDEYTGILPGNPVCWQIVVKENQTVEPSTEPLMFMATIQVHGAGGALLDTRDVYFLVPPRIEGPGIVGK